MQPHWGILETLCWAKETRHKRTHILWCFLCKNQKLAKPTNRGDGSENTDYLRQGVWVWTGKEHEGTFWGCGNNLHLTLNGIYMGIYLCTTSLSLYLRLVYFMNVSKNNKKKKTRNEKPNHSFWETVVQCWAIVSLCIRPKWELWWWTQIYILLLFWRPAPWNAFLTFAPPLVALFKPYIWCPWSLDPSNGSVTLCIYLPLWKTLSHLGWVSVYKYLQGGR